MLTSCTCHRMIRSPKGCPLPSLKSTGQTTRSGQYISQPSVSDRMTIRNRASEQVRKPCLQREARSQRQTLTISASADRHINARWAKQSRTPKSVIEVAEAAPQQQRQVLDRLCRMALFQRRFSNVLRSGRCNHLIVPRHPLKGSNT
jgi:hypothetical protein